MKQISDGSCGSGEESFGRYVFMTYLDEVEKSSPNLLKAEEMPEKEALEALQDKK